MLKDSLGSKNLNAFINLLLVMAHHKLHAPSEMRRITLNEYLGIVDSEADEIGANARAAVLSRQKKWWDLFYKRNENRFFKDRHWTLGEFPEVTRASQDLTVWEAGCGVGNFVIPLLSMNPKLKLFASDISEVAVDVLKKSPSFREDRCTAFQFDLVSSQTELHKHIPESTVDVATLVFVLSAIPPEGDNMKLVVRNLHSALKPGGLVLFRDYADGDHAQHRFDEAGASKKPFANCKKCYVRRDNTLSYFFTIDEANRLFGDVGFEIVESSYVFRETVNRKENVNLKRKFIQSRFKKNNPIF